MPIEGFDAIEQDFLKVLYDDPDPRVRAAAIRITEPFFHRDMRNVTNLSALTKDKHPDVAIQVFKVIALREGMKLLDAMHPALRCSSFVLPGTESSVVGGSLELK